MTNLLGIQGCTRFGTIRPNFTGLSRRCSNSDAPAWRNYLLTWCLVGILAFSAPAAMAQSGSPVQTTQAGDILVRAHVLGIFPENSGSSITTINGSVDISKRVAPEVDLSYYFTDHIAAQLIATMTRVSVKANGTAVGDVSVGAVTVLPPTLTAQYHFTPHSAFSPYVGAGATIFITFAADPSRGNGVVSGLHTDGHIAPALQAGFDYNFASRWFLNFEINQIFVPTHATVDLASGGSIQAKVDVNPFLVGAGIGYRF